MMSGQQPIIILKEGTQREKGKGAQMNNIMAARAISDAVKSTLGPKGMDKMLVDSMGDATVTNDGATILKEIDDIKRNRCRTSSSKNDCRSCKSTR
jgi:chaperonin GroEL (HSP60 family)